MQHERKPEIDDLRLTIKAQKSTNHESAPDNIKRIQVQIDEPFSQ